MDNKITRKYTVFDDNNDSSSEEKTDATPENMKKIDDVILSSITDNKTSFNNYGNVEKTSIKENIFKTTDTAGVVLNDELKIIEDESPPNSPISSINDISNNSSAAQQQQNLAFTIDFVGGNTQNNTKYKTMLERFQNRHRRGASMSKLDNNINCDDNCNNSCSNNKIISSPIVTKTPRISSSSSTAAQNRDSRKNYNDTEAGKIKLRIRERSTSNVKDPLKRHSWSPRSSTVEPNFSTKITTTAENLQQKQNSHQNTQNKLKSTITVSNKEQRQPINNEKLHQQQSKSQTSTENSRKTSNSGIYKQSGRNDFAPRSTAMQMALDKIDFLGLQPPLDNYIESNKNYNLIDGCDGDNGGNDDNISETGTYTLDGDNYTEEQKDLMNIDKTLSEMGQISNERPSELSIYSFSSIKSQQQEHEQSEKRYKNNILEVNYFHDATNVEQITKPKISYLEKIKSKVKNFTKSPDKIINKQQQQMCSSDKGTFTSITTSGILAKKLTLDPNPKLNYRKNSLTTSQLDSSEYIGNDYIIKSSATPITNINNSEPSYYTSGVFTDHEKAEYHLLNKQQQNNSDGCDECDIENEPQPLTPDCTSINNKMDFKKYSDTAGLKTAQTKSDWIQEWARNARARSVSTTTTSSSVNNSNKNDKIINDLMSRSYNCEATNENQSELIDNINYSPGNSDYIYNRKNNSNLLYKNINSSAINEERKKSLSELILTGRPPVSPSKIPSPMHSIGRSRSINKNNNNNNCRSSLQDLSPASQFDTNTDIYLQKTAAAISNLTQNLSRKNSIRSLNSINSPRKNLQQHNMINNDNNLFKMPTDNDNRNNIIQHKRNLSFDYRLQNNSNKKSMSNSLNETINDYRLPRPRINSFDSNNLQQYKNNNNNSNCSPRQLASNYIDQTLKLIKQNHHQQQQQSLSPLRRSSSFSTNKIGRMTPPTITNKSILPATSVINNQRYNNNSSNSQSTTPKNSLQKSASSNSFRKMYSNDYDDSIQYYINDEDDLDYCSSEEFDDQIESSEQQQQQPDIPLTNTRYNKALLMRIENSKQKVAGGGNSGGTTTKPAPGGVMACPNTPEMPRRQQNIQQQQQQQRNSMRQSVPRDSSLNRLKGDVPNSLASAKKQLLQTAASNSSSSSTKPQPRYLDISKYKPQQGSGNTFLKKNESKITLKNDIRRSPSSVSVSLSRNDPSRSSSRSTRSTIGGGRPSSAVNKRDQSISKQKETELAMWKRRATYDPMKAAAEDKRKKEEAKKLLIKSTESSSVLRSQSFHCGVGGLINLDNNNKINLTRRNSQTPDDICWTLISSDDEDEEEDGTFISSSTNTTN